MTLNYDHQFEQEQQQDQQEHQVQYQALLSISSINHSNQSISSRHFHTIILVKHLIFKQPNSGREFIRASPTIKSLIRSINRSLIRSINRDTIDRSRKSRKQVKMYNSLLSEDLQVRLKGFKDWNQWKSLFQSKANAEDIWVNINPEDSNAPAFMMKPRLPDLPDAPMTQGAHTRAASASDTLADTDKFHWKIYEIHERQYASQLKAISSVKRWVEATVDPILRQMNCLPHENLRIWFKNLSDAVGTDTQLARGQATLAFQDFMTPTTKVPKDLNAWVIKFETIMMESQALKVPNSMEAICWYTALQHLTRPFLGLKLDIWKAQVAQEIRDNTLTYREVANMLRFELETDERFKRGNQGVKRGAFLSSQEKSSEQPTFDQESEEEIKAAPLRKKKKTMKKKKAATSNTTRRACPACEQTSHTFTKCYYTFPDEAPDGFKEFPATRRTVDENLANDPVLAREAERIRKKKKDEDS